MLKVNVLHYLEHHKGITVSLSENVLPLILLLVCLINLIKSSQLSKYLVLKLSVPLVLLQQKISITN